jgi:hypothetical protein
MAGYAPDNEFSDNGSHDGNNYHRNYPPCFPPSFVLNFGHGVQPTPTQRWKSSNPEESRTTRHHWAISTFQSLGVTFPPFVGVVMDVPALERTINTLESSLNSLDVWLLCMTALVVIGLILEYWHEIPEAINKLREVWSWKPIFVIVG